MAGGGGDDDNPVPVNVVALIDILLCLLLFYMCVSKFAEIDGKMAAWLPKDKGANAGPAPPKVLEEVRVSMDWINGATIRKFGQRVVKNLGELEGLVVQEYKRKTRGKTLDSDMPSVILEATGEVPWRDVIEVMDMCRRNDITKIEFAFTKDAGGRLLGK